MLSFSRSLLLLKLIALTFPALAVPPPKPRAEPVRVLVLGVYHFGNPKKDLHDAKADDMLAPRRQSELADLAERLARFHPTLVALETQPPSSDLVDSRFSTFSPADLTKDPNEIAQIGYRLGRLLGLASVYGIDERGERYFPFEPVEEYARKHRATALLDRVGSEVQKSVEKTETVQRNAPVRLALASLNDPATILREHDLFYYSMLRLGDDEAQPGAELNAMWYERNAKIFTKLLKVAKSGDRVVVVFGAGHAYWLRHFVQNTPGFVLEDPLPYLKARR